MLHGFRRKPAHASDDSPVPVRSIGFTAIATVLIVGLGVAGCGSSGSSDTVTAISKSEFLAKGNAICTKGNAESIAMAAKAFGDKRPTPAELKDFFKAQAPLIQGQIDQIRALGAPSGDEDTVKQMLDLAQADLDKLKSNPALAANQNQFDDFTKVARPYGLTACAQN